MVVSITVPLSKRIKLDLNKIGRDALERAKRRIEHETVGHIPVDTGRLRESFSVDVSGEGVRLKWGAPYAYDVDVGVGKHKIEPATAEALVFTVDGKTVYAKEVDHPGFEGRDYVDKVVQQARQIVVEEIEAAIGRAS